MNAADVAHPAILVKHAEPIFAAGLAASLRSIPGFLVPTSQDMLAHEGRFRIMVCDYDTSQHMARGMTDIHVVVVARRPRDFEIQDAMARGVLGYVAASCSLGELESAVREAAQGRRFLCQVAAREIANGLTTESLTMRERDVLLLLAQGSCNKTIANGLDIALGTVKAHVRAIMAKLGASSRTEAASIAVARGLISESTMAGAVRPARPSTHRVSHPHVPGHAASAACL